MTKRIEPKPCRCGTIPTVEPLHGTSSYLIACPRADCLAQFVIGSGRADAIKKWNKLAGQVPFGYLARDVDGNLWWFENKPEEYDGAHIEANYHDNIQELDRNLYPEIKPCECRPFFGSI